MYIYKSICNKDSEFYDQTMFNQFSRFHFIPILCGAILFLIAETKDNGNRKDRERNIVGMVVVIISLASLIFIYIKTNLPGDWMSAIIKKGAYSSLIAFEWYYFCYDIINLRINDESYHVTTINACGIVFAVIIGVGALIFSFYFKDVVIPGIFFIFYIAMAIFFFGIDSDFRERYEYIKYIEGIIEIIMALFSLSEAIFLIYKHKN